VRSRTWLLCALVFFTGIAADAATNFELFDVIRINPGSAVEGSCATPCFRVILVVVVRTKSGSTASMSPTFVIEPSKLDAMAEVRPRFRLLRGRRKSAIANVLAGHAAAFSRTTKPLPLRSRKKLQSSSDSSLRGHRAEPRKSDSPRRDCARGRNRSSTEDRRASAGTIDIDVSALTTDQIKTLRHGRRNIPASRRQPQLRTRYASPPRPLSSRCGSPHSFPRIFPA